MHVAFSPEKLIMMRGRCSAGSGGPEAATVSEHESRDVIWGYGSSITRAQDIFTCR
jgi:hypothetical protein